MTRCVLTPLLLVAFCLIGCAKETKPESVPVVAKRQAPEPLPPKAPAPDRVALGKLFHQSRCVLIGALPASSSIYTSAGFTDDEAFRVAFTKVAEDDPLWVHNLVAASAKKPCKVSKEGL
ncbi:MAG: hypothetical protein KC502_11600 [Myxococcales bacterium]|nr:hypothetical protein [Myxococcales bacterium]